MGGGSETCSEDVVEGPGLRRARVVAAEEGELAVARGEGARGHGGGDGRAVVVVSW